MMKIISKIIYQIKRIIFSKEKIARKMGVNIGKNCSIATLYFGSEPYLITIGDHVQITQDVRFYTHGGGWVFREKVPDFDTFGKISVGNNVYIGNSVHILPGVTIEDNVIIGAGSVVTKSIRKNAVVAGNPAKEISSFELLLEKSLPFNVNTKSLNPTEKKAFLLNLENNKFINR